MAEGKNCDTCVFLMRTDKGYYCEKLKVIVLEPRIKWYGCGYHKKESD